MRKLLFKEKEYNMKDTISIIIYIMILSGLFGFIYETIFYRIDLGYFTKRGSTFGPIIPIYVYGGLLITMFTYKYKSNPLLVFILNLLITGILEYTSGYFILKFFHIRLWNYNIEMLNFLNINGFICLRSVLFFGLSGLFLIYILIPMILKIFDRFSKNKLHLLSYILGIIYVIDRFLYILLK